MDSRVRMLQIVRSYWADDPEAPAELLAQLFVKSATSYATCNRQSAK